MKKLISLLALYVVCSGDGGLTQITFRNAHHIFYKEGCLVWMADQVDGYTGACGQESECIVREGVVPPAGSPSEDYLKQESTGTVKQ